MAEKVATIWILTMAPGPAAPPASDDDSGPNREAPEPFRAVADRQDPNRAPADRQDPIRARADRQDPNRKDADRQDPNRRDADRQDPKREDADRQDPNRKDADRQDPNRKDADRQDPKREDADRQDPNRGAAVQFRAVAERQDPNRDLDPCGGSPGSPVACDALDAIDAIDAPDAPDAIDAQLLDRVWWIAQNASRHCDGVLQLTYEYSLPQILVLRAIVAAEQTGRPALCASEVAHELQCSRANVSEIVATLVRMNTLTKRRDPANQRVVRLYPTPTGRLTEFHARGLLAEDASRAFATLASADKEILLALLQKVASLP
jgi:DNA-binding MarR family transcriptional regulator